LRTRRCFDKQPSGPTSTIRDMRLRTPTMMPLLGVFLLCGCTREKAILVLDEQWSEKQAAADCRSRSGEGVPPCADDPALMIREFETQTSRAFKLSAACRGMTLVTLNASDNPSQLNSRHTWWLFLELMRSNVPNELRYTVSRTQDPHRSGSATGQGEPDSIVQQFCDFVQKGGIVE
jgi:hypothetical protein